MAKSVEDTLLVRMEASLRKFERQMERGQKIAEKSAIGSERAWDKAGKMIAANSNQAARGMARLTQVSGRGRFVIQNTANQIGDMAVQIQGGTSAARAMGQQIPQLLGGFGVLGGALGTVAPLLGTVAALGLPVAAALLAVGEKAETVDEKLSKLEKTIAALRSAQELSAISAGDLVAQYGGLADEAEQIFEINRKIAEINAKGALDSLTRGVADELGVEGVFGFTPDDLRELDTAIAATAQKIIDLNSIPASTLGDTALAARTSNIEALSDQLKGLRDVRKNIDEITEAFGITDEAAREVLARFAEIAKAEGARAQAEAMSSLAKFIHEASGNLVDASDEGKELYEQLLSGTKQALTLAKVKIASGIADGADEAQRLKEELAAALELQNRINHQQSKVYSGRGGDPRQFEDKGRGTNLNDPSIQDIIDRANRKARRGRSSADKGQREAKQLFEATRTEAERYALELERIEELHKRFPQVVTREVKDRAVSALNESMTLAGRMTQRLEKGFADAFTSFVTGAGSASDAIRALAADMAALAAQEVFKMFIDQVFPNLSRGLSGGGAPVVPSANGNVFDRGRVTPFANGGVVSSPTYFPMAGRNTGLMGEAGPEAIMPLARVNGKLGVRSSGGGGEAEVGVYVNVHNYGSSNVSTEKGPDGRLDIVIRDQMRGAIATGQVDQAMRQRFNIRPKAQGV